MSRYHSIVVSIAALLLSDCATDPIRTPPCSGSLSPINVTAASAVSRGALTGEVSHERH